MSYFTFCLFGCLILLCCVVLCHSSSASPASSAAAAKPWAHINFLGMRSGLFWGVTPNSCRKGPFSKLMFMQSLKHRYDLPTNMS